MASSTNETRLGGVAEVAAELGVSRQQVAKLRARPDFPSPLDEIAAGPVWDLGAVSRWNSSGARRGRGRPRQTPEQTMLGGRFKLEASIGKGGFADVFRGIDLQGAGDDTVVAVKALRALDDSEARSRFLRELRIVEELSHPNIVPILAYGEDEAGQLWYAMPLATGSLAEAISEFTGKESKIVDLMKQLCTGLEYLHNLGVFHRDLKPGNVLRMRSGAWAISDFGLARQEGSDSTPLTSTRREGLGTHIYTAPEQWLDAGSAGVASDVYGLGKILQELVTGDPPISSDLPDMAFRRIVQKATRTDPERRYSDAQLFLDDLQRESSAAISWETSGEALERLALRVAQDPPDVDALHELMRIAGRYETDPHVIADLDAVVPLIPSSGLTELWEADPEGVRTLIEQLAQHVGETIYEWAFCDTLADFFQRVVAATEDPVVTASALLGLMHLGQRHDRWRVRSAFISILQGIREREHALTALAEFEQCEPAALSWALQGFAVRSLHPVLRDGLTQKLQLPTELPDGEVYQ